MFSHYTTIYLLLLLFLGISSFKPLFAIQTLSNNISYKLSQQQKNLNNYDYGNNPELILSRKHFKKAFLALDKNNKKEFQKYFKQLDTYPLAIFLQYKKLRKNINKSTDKEINQFIKQYKDTPYAERIRKKWLDKLAKGKRWQSYLTFYIPQQSTRRQCDYLSALINNNKQTLAYSLVKDIWLNAKSQPKSCDPVFKAWENAGNLTDELRWQRIRLAMSKGQISLAKYIAKPMSKKDKDILSQWVTLHRKPHKLLSSGILLSQHKMQQDIILHSVKRLARKKPKQAAELLATVIKKSTLADDKLYQAYRAIGLSFAQKHRPGGWEWLSKIPDNAGDLRAKEWRVRAAIREQNNKAIVSSINRLPEDKQQSQRWSFWLANAKEALGDKTAAIKIYKNIAQERGYYAFLAADKINSQYTFNHKPIKLDASKFDQIKQYPGVQRAYEFLKLDMKTDAKREWYFVTRKLFNKDQQVLAAKLAQSWDWHDRAILTIANTDVRDDIDLRFPLMLEKAVEKYSNLNKLDMAYTYAVIRRESAFAIDARSPVGAMGLMQIMPATGKQVAKKLKLPYKSKKQLYSYDFNLKLGTNYLQDMLTKFHQQPALASAAYNAGGHRVKAWLPKKKSIKAVDWVESIPFKETREYVSAIFAYTAIYQHRLGKTVTRLTHRMPDVPSKK